MRNKILFFFSVSVLLAISTGYILFPSKDDNWLLQFNGFEDAIKHYQNKNGKDYQRYQVSDFTLIADNLLLYQKNNGGWIENQDPLRILSEEDKKEFHKK